METTSSSFGGDKPTLRVLVAEDEATNRLIISTIFSQVEIRPEFALDGAEAVEKWRQGAFDLILMDVRMPKMDGLEATRAIRDVEREQALPRTPIIAVTANVTPREIDAQFAAGVDAHVPKPIQVGELFAAMTRALKGRDSEGPP